MLNHGTGFEAQACRKAAVDFQNKLNVVAAKNGRLVQRLRIFMDVSHRTVRADKDHVEGNERISHPERDRARRIVDKEHAFAKRHLLDEHKASGTFFVVIRNFDAESGKLLIGPQRD